MDKDEDVVWQVAELKAMERGPRGVVLELKLEGAEIDGSASCWLAHTAEGVTVFGSPLGSHGYDKLVVYSDGRWEEQDAGDCVIDEGTIDEIPERKRGLTAYWKRQARKRPAMTAAEPPPAMPEPAGPELSI